MEEGKTYPIKIRSVYVKGTQIADVEVYEGRYIICPFFSLPVSHPLVTKYLIRKILEPNKEMIPYKINIEGDNIVGIELESQNKEKCDETLNIVLWLLRNYYRRVFLK